MGTYKGYYRAKETRKDSDFEELIAFGKFYRDGTEEDTMVIGWYRLGGRLVPQFNPYDQSWDVVSEFRDIIAAINENENRNMSPEEIIDILNDHGLYNIEE